MKTLPNMPYIILVINGTDVDVFGFPTMDKAHKFRYDLINDPQKPSQVYISKIYVDVDMKHS